MNTEGEVLFYSGGRIKWILL